LKETKEIDPNLLLRDQQEIKKALDDGASNYESSKMSYIINGNSEPLISLIAYYKDLLKKLVYYPQNRAEIYYRIGKIYLDLGRGQRDLSNVNIINPKLGLPDVKPLATSQPSGTTDTSQTQPSGTVDQSQTQATGKNLPQGFSININDGAQYATNNKAKITINGNNINNIYLSTDDNFKDNQALPYKGSYEFTLSGVGVKTIFAKAVSTSGGEVIAKDDIYLDTIPPEVSLYKVPDNDGWKNKLNVGITCIDVGSGCSQSSFRIWFNPHTSDCKAANYAKFGTDDEVKSIPVKVCAAAKDLAGNIGVTPIIEINDKLDTKNPIINKFNVEERRSLFKGLRYFVEVEVEDNIKVKNIDFYINGVKIRGIPPAINNDFLHEQYLSDGSYVLLFNGEIKPISQPNDGVYNIQMIVYDLAGNKVERTETMDASFFSE